MVTPPIERRDIVYHIYNVDVDYSGWLYIKDQ